VDFLVAGGPLGVLLGDEALDPFGQLPVPVLPNIGSGPGQIQVALVLEGLGGGAVGDPVLLELVEMLDTLQDDDDGRQAAATASRTTAGR
jgi:hypothetical protein